jgi:hypothetical protein
VARPLPDRTLFLDHCLGATEIAKVLKANGQQVEVLADHFRLDCDDTVWLAEVGRRGWVVLSKDKAIRRRSVERNAVVAAGVYMFVLTSGEMSAAQMAAAFASAVKRIRKVVRDYEPPVLASVSSSGAVQLLTTPTRRAAVRRNVDPDVGEGSSRIPGID